MSKLTLERHQVWIYLSVIFLGGLWGWHYPEIGDRLEPFIDVVIGFLLYSTFCQVPLIDLRQAFRHQQFLMALVVANFIIVPFAVWLLANLLLNDPKLQFGIFLVLLVPCTDWFLTFAYLGKGNLNLAVASTPILLLLQSIFLPFYIFLFSDQQFTNIINVTSFANVFVNLILIPLGLALLTQQGSKMKLRGTLVVSKWLMVTSWLPIPLLALVLLLVSSSQASQLSWKVLQSLPSVIIIFIIYLMLAGYIAGFVGKLFQLDTGANRTLAFSVGSRNSFVVLPFALTLPPEWEIVVTIVVLQPLIELTGLMIYLWWIPYKLLKDSAKG